MRLLWDCGIGGVGECGIGVLLVVGGWCAVCFWGREGLVLCS